MASVTPQASGGKPAAAPALGLHQRLDLDETLAALVADGVITDADATRVRADVRTARGRTELHPLVHVANPMHARPARAGIHRQPRARAVRSRGSTPGMTAR